jgi:hypothetical protein
VRDIGTGSPRPIACALAVGLAASAVHAQLDRGEAPTQPRPAPSPTPGEQPDLAQLVTDLGSASVQTRIDAHTRLLEARSITLSQIEQFIRAKPLSAEQRLRLLNMAYQRFLTEPRAAMGIQADSNSERGVVLTLVVPEFPAAQVLKVRDRFVTAAGTTIDTWDALRAVIISRDPDDEIPVTVVRDGATLNLRVKLGSFNRLNNGRMENSIRDAAWELRSKDLRDPALSETKPIESGLTAGAWFNPGVIHNDAADIQLVEAGPSARTGVVAGGESRGGVPRVADGMTGGARVMPRDGRGRPMRAGPQDAAQAEVWQQLQIVQTRRAQSVAMLEIANRTVAEPTIDELTRQAMRARITQLEAEIRAQDLEVQKLLRLVRP